MRRLVEGPSSATWIAEEDTQMAGFAIVDWARELTRESNRIIAYIQTLEVAPAHRNRGIANQLLRRIEASATAAGAKVMSLHVAEGNAAAIRLYHSHGYISEGREDDYYAPGISALILVKTLENLSGRVTQSARDTPKPA
jgi:ribosomal protein S18 acetylase RimI-like enzyme